MSKTILLERALHVPAADITALLQGRLIVLTPAIAIEKGWSFALSPLPDLFGAMSLQDYYRPSFVGQAQRTVEQDRATANSRHIQAWARCEGCQILDVTSNLEILSKSTVWTVNALQQRLEQQKGYLILAYLQVYRLSQIREIPTNPSAKLGKFTGLTEPIQLPENPPILSPTLFNQRKQHLINLEPPPYPELEALQCDIAHLASTNPDARALDNDLCAFLGWRDRATESIPDSDLNWIRTIADVGNSSDGHAFEKLVRKSLMKLGFSNSNQNPKASLDPEATGGAGGLDVYCEQPFPLVGECKASKHEAVPNSVSSQLVHLGNTCLKTEEFNQAVKVIFAAGALTSHAENAAKGNKMNVIRPETLQRLVELKAHYPGAINLLDLKNCLENPPFGKEADDKLNRYVEEVWQQLRRRAQLVEATKRLTRSDETRLQVVEIRTQCNANFGTDLGDIITHKLLIELSSPLAGYLGRVEGDSLHSDLFYFLRDLVVE